MAKKIQGLTSLEVEEKRRAGLDNHAVKTPSKTIGEIVRSHIFTYFNLIFVVLAVILVLVGAPRDMTFMGVVIVNAITGIVQEIRAKQILDKVTVLNAPKARVVRDGKRETIPVEELVQGDVIILKAGDQIPADAKVVQGDLSVNEALLTGEADEIKKAVGDELMSGSFVVSGEGYVELLRVGDDSYAAKLTLQARAIKNTEQSEILRSLNKIVTILGVIIVPLGIAMVVQQIFIRGEGVQESVRAMVAAVVGMIPEGLFLLATATLVISVMKLAQQEVLVHEMKCIETLARVDVLCVDKTGTITEDKMEVSEIVEIVEGGSAILAEFAGAQKADNATMKAIKEWGRLEHHHFVAPGSPTPVFTGSAPLWLGSSLRNAPRSDDTQGATSSNGLRNATQENSLQDAQISNALRNAPRSDDAQNATSSSDLRNATHQSNSQAATSSSSLRVATKGDSLKGAQVYGFSSTYKYSAVDFGGEKFVLGAPELVLSKDFRKYRAKVEKFTSKGYRVLILGKYGGVLGEALTEPVEAVAMVILQNKVRSTATETFRFFAEQGVTVKVISGDNPVTVSEVAKQAGILDSEKYMDVTGLDGKELAKAVKECTVFGRVTPEQKRKLVRALQEAGHTVAMTGDGVNDVLALKDADCSVAMASGSQAAVQAAQLVLLDSDFSKMPEVVREGRRVVNNLERSGSLFLVKNMFSLTMAVLTIIMAVKYPLVPNQLTWVTMWTIGIPSFLLAQMPNHRLIQGKFVTNIMSRAFWGALADLIVVLSIMYIGNNIGLESAQVGTLCALGMATVGIIYMWVIARPMDKWKRLVVIGCAIGLALSAVLFPGMWSLTTWW